MMHLIITFLKLLPHLPGANELMVYTVKCDLTFAQTMFSSMTSIFSQFMRFTRIEVLWLIVLVSSFGGNGGAGGWR